MNIPEIRFHLRIRGPTTVSTEPKDPITQNRGLSPIVMGDPIFTIFTIGAFILYFVALAPLVLSVTTGRR